MHSNLQSYLYFLSFSKRELYPVSLHSEFIDKPKAIQIVLHIMFSYDEYIILYSISLLITSSLFLSYLYLCIYLLIYLIPHRWVNSKVHRWNFSPPGGLHHNLDMIHTEMVCVANIVDIRHLKTHKIFSPSKKSITRRHNSQPPEPCLLKFIFEITI